MDKKIVKTDEAVLSRIKEDLKDRYACYVLITCSPAESDGKMQVEMHFDGDEDLAGVLVETAQQAFGTDESRRESQ